MDSFFALIDQYLGSTAVLSAGAFGVAAAFADRRLIGRPVFGILIALAVIAGEIAMRVNPMPYLGGDYYVQGLLVSTFAIAALVGYAIAALAMKVFGRAAT